MYYKIIYLYIIYMFTFLKVNRLHVCIVYIVRYVRIFIYKLMLIH